MYVRLFFFAMRYFRETFIVSKILMPTHTLLLNVKSADYVKHYFESRTTVQL